VLHFYRFKYQYTILFNTKRVAQIPFKLRYSSKTSYR